MSLLNLSAVFSRFVLCFTVGFMFMSTNMYGQRDEWVRPGEKRNTVVQQPQQEKERTNDFASNLWYGGGVALGFASSNFQSDFLFGLFPMIGYHITPEFSFGLRAGISYNYTKFDVGSSRVEEFNLLDYSFGPLVRYKAFGPVFLHGEVELESNNFVYYDASRSDYFEDREFNVNNYLGIGYSPGGGFEMMILYNFSVSSNSIDSPFNYRVGYVYNF